MSTLAERMNFAFNELLKRKPTATKSELARRCGLKSPSVIAWFNGKSKNLTYTAASSCGFFFTVLI